MAITVRRVRAAEWPLVRQLRLEALRDESAGIAFAETSAQESLETDQFWQERAATAARGDDAAQFVAIDDAAWWGTATVLAQKAGSHDRHGRTVRNGRAVLVGVYVHPERRGTGLIGLLLEAAERWSHRRGFHELTLEVHRDNTRAQRAYRSGGFLPSGATFTGPAGPQLEMVLTLRHPMSMTGPPERD